MRITGTVTCYDPIERANLWTLSARVILCFNPGPSWQINIDEPEDLHLALFVRDACGLTVSASPGPLRAAPSLAHPVPADERAGIAAARQAWWDALLSAH
jgi:hypothetical protein